MPGISQKVLTQQLRELVSDGIVRRQPTGAIPAPVEVYYTLEEDTENFGSSLNHFREYGKDFK